MIDDKITYIRSTSFSFEATIDPPAGLSVTKGLFTIKTGSFDDNPTDSTALYKDTVNANNNVLSFSLKPDSFADSVEPGKYYYSIHVAMTDRNIYPFASGVFELKATTTNREL